MNCRESLTLDLAEFVARASAPEFAAFRAHYPRCLDCAGEVRAWTEVYAALSASTHPSPDTLLHYQDAKLPESDRRGVARHLATCGPCRDELRALAVFDLEAAHPARPVVERKPWFRPPDWVRLVLHPALAYGLVLALLFYPAWRNSGLRPQYAPVPSSSSPVGGETFYEPSREERAAPREQKRGDDSRDTRQEAPAAQAAQPPKLAAKQRVAETPPSAPAAGGRAKADEAAREADSNQLAGLAKGKTSAEEVVLLLRAGGRAQLEIADEAGEVTLRAPIGSELSDSGSLEVRVFDANGDREIRERIAPVAGHVSMRVPRAWLAPGTYRFAARPAGTAAREDSFDFEVRRPRP
jgi:hypothetical protein